MDRVTRPRACMLGGMASTRAARTFRLVGAAWAIVVAFASCSSSSASPPTLGGCTSMDGSSCATGSGGGNSGSSGGSRDGSTDQDSGVVGEASVCGTAASLLNTLNNQCLPCVATSCCQAEAACTGQCLSLVSCTGGINVCETQFPGGITAYNDFAMCLAMSCPTQCPALPLAT